MRIAIFIVPLLFLSTTSYAVNGIYTLLQTGYADGNHFPSAREAGADKKQTPSFPSIYRVGIGYNHDLSARLGVGLEVDYSRTSTFRYLYAENNKINIYLRYLAFLASAQWHEEKWDVIGKAGVARQRIVISGANVEQEDGAKLCPQVGIDLAYNVTAHWALVGSVDHVFGNKIRQIQQFDHQAPGMSTVLVGLRIIF